MDSQTLSIISLIATVVLGIIGILLAIIGIQLTIVGMHQGKQPQQQLGKSRNSYSLSKKKGNSATLIGVVTILFAMIIAVNWKSNLAPSSTYPNVTGQYEGTIYNSLALITTWMKLSIKQNEGNISGVFTVGPELKGNGPFMGAVDAAGSIQFTVHSKDVREPLSFWGTVHSGANISGSYCSLNEQNKCDPNWGKGTWNMKRKPSTSNINLRATDAMKRFVFCLKMEAVC